RQNLQANPNVGTLAIEFATRRRMRVNGNGELRDNSVMVYAQQVYSNCPKYIQEREWELPDITPQASHAEWCSALTMTHQVLIGQADTFFIGSFHPQGGADASHRGGNPGFIMVLDEKTLLWPDYIGNNMFNTLGNITAYPQAGLLFVDFKKGTTLQLTGTAEVVWDMSRAKKMPGAQRMVQFSIAAVIKTQNALSLRWRLRSYSPFNPGE
ncbi:MAG: pyridoxamine 5'-phosphate oxidase family protein, partial [Gammaproteobacteria bacterium]|nr:pyridoxamine 5'-phosphate oxidase family protein [Gammaproteobacteria bacterium]